MMTAGRGKWRAAGGAATVAVLWAALWAGPARAQAVGRPAQTQQIVTPLTLHAPSSAVSTAASIDPFELQRWADAWFRSHLDAPDGAPGAVVAVVQRGRVVLLGGYGVANLETRAPVTLDTVFRAGSISKPFTASAVMQLVEAGRIQLTAPVNRYLRDLQVPAAFGRPVTVIDLATHTAGFDVRLEGTAAAADRDVQALGPYLRAALPPQVRRSGDILSYSNHGYALLGHLVEQVSGLPFETYMADRVFAPLGMPRSSFRLTADAEKEAATGYERSAAGFRRSAPIHPHIYPAAGLNTTARDMTRFMIAQLDGGRVNGARLLSALSVAEMQRQHFTQSPAMPGVTLGFFENVTRGERALVHGGGIRGFMSGLCLWPRHDLGLFISNNGYSGALVQRFLGAFVEHYFPPARTQSPRLETPPALDAFEGVYRAASQTRGSLEKAAALFGGDVVIRAVGGYSPHLDFGGDRFVPTASLAFTLDGGDEPLAFRPGAGRKMALLVTVTPWLGCEVFERVPWYETARWHRELLALFCASFLSVLLAPFASPLLGRVGRRLRIFEAPTPSRRATPDGRWARAVLFLVAGLDLVFLLLLVIAFRFARDAGVLYGIPPLARLDLVLADAASLLALTLPFWVWRAWRRRCWSTADRLHYSACAAAALAFVAFLHYWKLLGS